GATVADDLRRAQSYQRRSASTEQGFAELAAADATGSLWNVAGVVATNPRMVMSVVASSLGATAPQLALSAAMPASRIMQAITGGGGSFTAEQGFTVLDVMDESGVDTTDPVAVAGFLRDKRRMDQA